MTRLAVLLTLALTAYTSGASVASHRFVAPWDRLDAPAQYRALVWEAAESAGVPAWILAALIRHESRWDAEARGDSGATVDLGMCQLNSRYLAYFSERYNCGEPVRPLDPASAVPVAARLLADLHSRLGTWERALAAYNAGEAGERAGRGREYAARVLCLSA
jgi:soluble lytic murein transglycosylase-like protein